MCPAGRPPHGDHSARPARLRRGGVDGGAHGAAPAHQRVVSVISFPRLTRVGGRVWSIAEAGTDHVQRGQGAATPARSCSAGSTIREGGLWVSARYAARSLMSRRRSNRSERAEAVHDGRVPETVERLAQRLVDEQRTSLTPRTPAVRRTCPRHLEFGMCQIPRLVVLELASHSGASSPSPASGVAVVRVGLRNHARLCRSIVVATQGLASATWVQRVAASCSVSR